MKQYPSIRSSTGTSFQEIHGAYIFDKLDGSNIRAEWRRKKGWYKFGSRTQLLRPDDKILGGAVSVFVETMAELLAKMALDNRMTHLLVFMEYAGPNSFAGWHDPNDKKSLYLFDICPDNKGIVGPTRFLKLTENIEVPKPYFFGCFNWTRGLIDSIRAGTASFTPSFEGVVGKAGDGHSLIMAKAKTQAMKTKLEGL